MCFLVILLQGSQMRIPATKYLMLRALGAPANVMALTIQGIFRGIKDTRTPLYAIGMKLVYDCENNKFVLMVVEDYIIVVCSCQQWLQYLIESNFDVCIWFWRDWCCNWNSHITVSTY